MKAPMQMIPEWLTPVVELNGDIGMGTTSGPDQNALIFRARVGGLSRGRYGAGTWWLPMGTGYGLKCSVGRGVEERAKIENVLVRRKKQWRQLVGCARQCAPYLPEVHGWFLAVHTGWADNYEFQRGRSHIGGVEHDAFWMVACIVKEYEHPKGKQMPDADYAAMAAAFAKDGVELNAGDSMWSRQIGVEGELEDVQYKLLDIVDSKGVKYL